MTIIFGCLLIVIGLALFVADFGERLTEGVGVATQQAPIPKNNGVVVIDVDGKVIAPPGVQVWQPDRQSYDAYESLCNTHPIRHCTDSYEWYLQDIAGTPITDEQYERILGHYADPHPNYHEVTGEVYP